MKSKIDEMQVFRGNDSREDKNQSVYILMENEGNNFEIKQRGVRRGKIIYKVVEECKV